VCIVTSWRDSISWLLIAVALGCFVAGAFPRWSERVDPATGDKFTELRLGLWFSPAYEQVRRDYDRSHAWDDQRGVGESRHRGWETHAHINWLSWSSFAVVIGLGSLMILRRRREAFGGHQDQKPEAQTRQ
jgi:hypothetical protein